MTSQESYLNVELFRVNETQLKEAFSHLKGSVCLFNFPDIAYSTFPSERDRLFHVARLLGLNGTRAIVLGDEAETELVALEKPKADVLYMWGQVSDQTRIHLQASEPEAFHNPMAEGFQLARTLLTDSLRSKIGPPLKIEGSTVFDTSTDLTKVLTQQSKLVELLQPLHVHTGFSFQFRTFGNRFYLQILPKSTIAYDKSISNLINGGWSESEIVNHFPYVKIQGTGGYSILEVGQLTSRDHIDSAPYLGRSFESYAKTMYPNESTVDPNQRLVKVASHYGEISYLPCSWAYPSLTFTGISRIDDGYYSELTGILKTQSRKRAAQAQNWATKVSALEIGGRPVEVMRFPTRLHYDPTTLEPSKFSFVRESETGFTFGPPSVTLKRDGKPTEIVPGVGLYQGTVNDILSNEEIKPLDVPPRVRLLALIQTSLRDGWLALKNALVNGTVGYRGFEGTFGVDLVIDEKYVDDFLDPSFAKMAKSLGEQSYDCALTVIPRILETRERSRAVYEQTKTEIMQRGIPVQAVVNDTRVTTGRDDTLLGKSKKPRALFGLSINILAKVGGILTAISPAIANNLIPDSITIGYDLIRVVPKEFAHLKTIPLAAPLVIFDNRGAYISHQEIYKLRTEVSLFEEYGDEIFGKIPREVSRVILHKDGPFTQTELSTLETLSKKYGVESIPISITTGFVPRVSNPNYLASELGFKAGTTLPLSNEDYLMVTTAFGSWDPDRLGWPNPILIKMHGADRYESARRLRLLYHIFALTKMQTGSQRATRLPVSIHFANMIGRFLRRVGDPNPTYLKYFVQVREDGKYLPRWFL